jgi:hypothetical protein
MWHISKLVYTGEWKNILKVIRIRFSLPLSPYSHTVYLVLFIWSHGPSFELHFILFYSKLYLFTSVGYASRICDTAQLGHSQQHACPPLFPYMKNIKGCKCSDTRNCSFCPCRCRIKSRQ